MPSRARPAQREFGQPFPAVADYGKLSARDRCTLPRRSPYGHDVAKLFNVEAVQTATTKTLKVAPLAATRVTSTVPGSGMSAPFPIDRAYVVSLQLRHSVSNEWWKAGRPVPTGRFLVGSIMIAHLEEQPRAYLPDPFDALLFYIPQMSFDELADGHGSPRIQGLAEFAGLDPVIHHIGRALLPALADPQYAGELFFDHLAFALYSRLATRYGQIKAQPLALGRFLTAAQERKAKELLTSNLRTEPSIATIASACHLPTRRFLRAFRQTTGMPPYRWLRQFRVERSKELLLKSPTTLAEIAYDCGFADQSHFTRVFAATVGTTPGAWRRARRI